VKLYQLPLSPSCQKVVAIAHEVGVPLELVNVELFKGEGRTPAMLAKNPNGKVLSTSDALRRLLELPDWALEREPCPLARARPPRRVSTPRGGRRACAGRAAPNRFGTHAGAQNGGLRGSARLLAFWALL
jgi:hypothetical protein